MPTHTNTYPKLHNAAWPGLVGKGPDSEPPIDLDTMLNLTTAAKVDGVPPRIFLPPPDRDIGKLGSSSITRAHRPSCSAARSIVPEPPKQSKAISCGRVQSFKISV